MVVHTRTRGPTVVLVHMQYHMTLGQYTVHGIAHLFCSTYKQYHSSTPSFKGLPFGFEEVGHAYGDREKGWWATTTTQPMDAPSSHHTLPHHGTCVVHVVGGGLGGQHGHTPRHTQGRGANVVERVWGLALGLGCTMVGAHDPGNASSSFW